MEDDPPKMKNGRRPQKNYKKNEDDIKNKHKFVQKVAKEDVFQ